MIRQIGFFLLSLTLSGCALINPGVIEELEQTPSAPRAERTLVLELADGTRFPVNYFEHGGELLTVSGGRWWRRFQQPAAVQVLLRGSWYPAIARAVRDDPERRRLALAALRPRLARGLPGVLVVVLLQPASAADG